MEPRLLVQLKEWMPGSSPGLTRESTSAVKSVARNHIMASVTLAIATYLH